MKISLNYMNFFNLISLFKRANIRLAQDKIRFNNQSAKIFRNNFIKYMIKNTKIIFKMNSKYLIKITTIVNVEIEE